MVKPFSAGLLATCLAVFLVGCGTTPEPSQTKSDKPPVTPKVDDSTSKMATVDFEKDVKPVVMNYCLPCHGGPTPKNNVDVTKLTGTEKEMFGKMAGMVESGKMPPPNGKAISDADKAKLISDLKALAG